MKHNPLNEPNYDPLREISGEVVPPIYRLGEEGKNQDELVRGRRILSWDLQGNEVKMGLIAGWNIFPVQFGEHSGSMEIPTGTRSAKSILAGTEAWDGEKRAVVERAAQYLTTVEIETGRPDVNFSWSQVGVTPEQHIFIAPPNGIKAEITAEQVQTWKHEITHTLALFLQNDDNNQILTEQFAATI